jgi:integrase/recombinase XerD
MYEKLFKYPSVLSRHREAPFFWERESYLSHRAMDGTAPATLRRFARELLVIVREMDLSSTMISVEAIESAAEQWARHQGRRRRANKTQWSRGLFIQVAQDWLRFLGRLQEPKAKADCSGPLIEDFTRFLHRDRGLSDATVRNYVWYAERFLGCRDRPRNQGSCSCQM